MSKLLAILAANFIGFLSLYVVWVFFTILLKVFGSANWELVICTVVCIFVFSFIGLVVKGE